MIVNAQTVKIFSWKNGILLEIILIATLFFFIIGVFLRAWFFDYSDADSGVLEDHFINSIVVKNINRGYGWATTGFELFPLNPGSMTTGPTMILPSVAIYRIFSDRLHATSISSALFNMVCFSLFVFLLNFRYESKEEFKKILLGTLIVFLCFYPHYWVRLIGEIPAFLLFVSGGILLTKALEYEKYKGRYFCYLVFSACLIGLSITSKLLMLIPLFGMIIFLGWAVFFEKKAGLFFSIKVLCVFMVFALMPLFFFHMYKAYVNAGLDPEWVLGVDFFSRASFKYDSGVVNLERYFLWADVPRFFYVVKKSFASAKSFFSGSYAQDMGVFVFFAIYFVVIVKSFLNRKKDLLSFCLVFSFTPVLAWFFLVGGASYSRYLFIPIIGIFFIFLLVCIEIFRGTRYQSVFYISFILFFLLSGFPEVPVGSDGNPKPQVRPRPAFLEVAARFPTTYSAYYESVRAISNNVESSIPDKLVGIGMWSTNVFEYLSNRENIFYNVTDFFSKSYVFDEAAYLNAYPEVEKLVSNGIYDSGFSHYKSLPFEKDGYANYLEGDRIEIRDIVKKKAYKAKIKFVGLPEDEKIFGILTAKNDLVSSGPPLCDNVRVEDRYYRLVECDREGMETYLKTITEISFRPMKWMRPKAIYPDDLRFF